MFALQSNEVNSRKRGRDNGDDLAIEGFLEHRSKRTLPLRTSPELRRTRLGLLSSTNNGPRSPSVADITPHGSDSDEIPRVFETKSAFSPWSSSPALSTIVSSQPSPSYVNSQPMSDTPGMPDYMDVFEPLVMSGETSYYSDPSIAMSSRIPTPIDAQFSRQLPAHFSQSMSLSQEAYGRERRLPSPISEGGPTPIRTDMSQEDTAMELDIAEDSATLKRGHSRSRHSLRNYTGFNPEAGGVKKFSMGYKADCEKCRMRVPGHFSHVIIVPSGYV